MNILLSNDDGVLAPGLEALFNELNKDYSVTVVAPDRNRSAASNSLSLDVPIRVKKQDNNFYAVSGTPTDCVHLGVTGLSDEEPDMVISGINDSANLGDDVIYSGTVAAAMEGRFLGLPAIAVSMVANGEAKNFISAAKAVTVLIKKLSKFNMKFGNILNVNVPDLPWGEIRGFMVARLGSRHKSEPIIKEYDPRGREMYWIGPAGKEQDAGEGTDFYAVNSKYVSVTPIHIDLTSYADLAELKAGLSND